MDLYLSELASRLGVSKLGDGDPLIRSVAPLEEAGVGSICFLANTAYRRHLDNTSASAVILKPEWAEQAPCPVLVSNNPYLTYAKAALLLYPAANPQASVHPSAVIAADVELPDDVSIGPCAVIAEGVCFGRSVYVGPGCVVGRGAQIGAGSRLLANVTLGERVVLGERVLIQPGAVIGADGFGFANDRGAWFKVPQLGSVVIGDDVEIGANTCIDRGSLRDTKVGRGVKIDNLVQVAHNVELGEHTAIAACVGIAGSTRIGRYCNLAGASGVVGHLQLADGVTVTAKTLVTHSLHSAGVYSGNIPADVNKKWQRNAVHFRHLDEWVQRIKKLEAKLEHEPPEGTG